MISVVLSIFNEVNNPYFLNIIKKLAGDPFFELVLIDGGSTDGTLDILKKFNLNYFNLGNSTRGARLNFGIAKATFDAVLLHHPRSMLSDEAWRYLKSNYESKSWRAFTHKFDHPHWFLNYISWYSNYVRVLKKNIVYLDHCIFFNKTLLGVDNIPDLAIFEDTALSELLNKNINLKICRQKLAGAKIVREPKILNISIFYFVCLTPQS